MIQKTGLLPIHDNCQESWNSQEDQGMASHSGCCSVLLLMLLILLYTPQLNSTRTSGQSVGEKHASSLGVSTPQSMFKAAGKQPGPETCYAGNFIFRVYKGDAEQRSDPLTDQECINSCRNWLFPLAVKLYEYMRGRSSVSCLRLSGLCLSLTRPDIRSINTCMLSGGSCPNTNFYRCSCAMVIHLPHIRNTALCNLHEMSKKLLERLKENTAGVLVERYDPPAVSSVMVSESLCPAKRAQGDARLPPICKACPLTYKAIAANDVDGWNPCFVAAAEACSVRECFAFPSSSTSERSRLITTEDAGGDLMFLLNAVGRALGQNIASEIVNHNMRHLPPAANDQPPES